jgi:metal-responsive CopG/Arc/MetJ family transcriptional regulator
MGRRRMLKNGYKLSVYVESDLVKAVQDEAWMQRKSVSRLVSEILQEYLERRQQNEEKKPIARVAQSG